MRAYRLVEYEIGAAKAATGNPFNAETVTPITGTFNLHSNDGYNLLLASSKLHKVGLCTGVV
jgi:hypothetical protein